MRTIKVLGTGVAMAFVLGAALPGLAQQPRSQFEDFGCAFDPDQLVDNGVINEGVFPEGFAPVGFVTHKNCPGSQANPVIQLECEIPLDPGPVPLVNLTTRNFTCLINGAQCGFNQTFPGTNNRLTIESALNEENESVGRVTMRCSTNVE